MDMPDIKGLFPEELSALLQQLGLPAFRGNQLFAWMHQRTVGDFFAMTDLPTELRQELKKRFSITMLLPAQEAEAPDGTIKFLMRLGDGHYIETVYIPELTRATVCVSTQVGCQFDCKFCATGQGGFKRNLTEAEIIDQVYRVKAATDRHISNVVYMGMGEPLANYDAVLRSVRLLLHPRGLNLSQRHITISTVGITPGIERLTSEGLQINLAISLHSPTQQGRLSLIPIAKKYPLDGLMAAARQYLKRTGRKVTFEYTVIPGRNDAPPDAALLAKLIRGMQCMVNVVPLNPIEEQTLGLRFTPTELLGKAQQFVNELRRLNVEVALRRSRGQEISGACGQLRRRG